MGNIFDQNLAVVRDRWPELSTVLRSVKRATCTEIGRRESTLAIGGIQLSGAYNRRWEALLQSNRVPEDASEVHLYGLGVGDLPRVMLERKGLRSLKVHLIAPAADMAVFSRFSQTDWLGDRRVTLHLGGPQSRLQRPYAVAPSALRLAEEPAYSLRNELVVDLNAGYTRAKWVEKKGFHMARLRETAARFEGDADVSELFDAGRGKTVVVAGGGPTLPECFEWIQKFRSDVFVISATTALRPMVLAGFRPDLVIGIDPAEDLHFHLWDVPDDVKASVSFAYAPMVDPSFVAVWTGPRFAFLLDAPLYEEVFPGSGRSKLASGGSVVHAAMDLAVRMKPSAVVLAGLDFCFVGGFTHSKGVSMHTPIEELPDARFSVLTGEGKCERADINLMAYLQETETFLARNPGVRFYNVSRRGAVIRGAKYLFEESPWC